MKQRGRKTVSAVAVSATVQQIPRAAPPVELSEFESHVWASVVNTKPADWFQADTLPLLLSYCKHVSTAATIDRELAEFDPKWLRDDDGLKRYKLLTDMRERESRAQTALARSMRLTQQSQYNAQTASSTSNKGKQRNIKPWQG